MAKFTEAFDEEEFKITPRGESFTRVDEVVDGYTKGLQGLAGGVPAAPRPERDLSESARRVRDGAIATVDRGIGLPPNPFDVAPPRRAQGRKRPRMSEAARRIRDEAVASVNRNMGAGRIPPNPFGAPPSGSPRSRITLPREDQIEISSASSTIQIPREDEITVTPAPASPAIPPNPFDSFLTEGEEASETARGATPTRVTDIAAAQAEQGGEVSGERPYLSPSERDEALAQYQREENARQDRERMAQAAAADPRSRPIASPVPALRGPDGEYRGEEMGLGPQPPMREVVSEEVEEEITEDTPENEEQIREVATMIAESKTNEEGEEEFDLNSARRRAYVTSGILDIVNGLILGIAGAQGSGVNRQAIASALASSDAPLEAFREMAQAARQRREAEDQRRRLMMQEARQKAADTRQARILEMREGEYRAEEGERARLAQLRDPESEGSATARAQYVTQLVDLGVPRDVAESRVEGQSGADIAARADEIEALRAARAQYFTPRRGVRRPSAQGWQTQLRGLGYSSPGPQGRQRPQPPARAREGALAPRASSPGDQVAVEAPDEWSAGEQGERTGEAEGALAREEEGLRAIEEQVQSLPIGSSRRNRAEQQLERARERVATRRREAGAARVSRGMPRDYTPPDERVNYYTRVPGGPDLSQPEIRELRQYVQSSRQYVSIARQLARLGQQMSAAERVGGAVNINSPRMRRARQLHGRLSTLQRQMQNMGVPQAFEMALVNREVPPLDSVNSLIGGVAAYESLVGIGTSEMRQNMAGMGYQLRQPVTVRDEQGRTRRMYPADIRARRLRNLQSGQFANDPNLGIEIIEVSSE